MELAQRYAYTVYKEHSFSRASRKLFISQPALSASISRLESDLGFKIFDRSTAPLSLTPEGKVYIEYLIELLEREGEMFRRVKALSTIGSGNLAIGGFCYTAYLSFAGIISRFTKLYPSVKVSVDMGSEGVSDSLFEKLHRGTLDLIFKYSYNEREFSGTPLLDERLVVAMHKNMVSEELYRYALSGEEIMSGEYDRAREFSDSRMFSSVKFLTIEKDSNTHDKMDELLGDYGTADFVIKNVKSVEMHYNMMREGLGAVLLADTHLTFGTDWGEDILYFVPSSPASHRTLYAITKRGTPRNPLSDEFVRCAVDFYKKK